VTTPAEVIAWFLMAILLIGGGFVLIRNWPAIRGYYQRRRYERARKFGYRHRMARLEFDASLFETVHEREGYRAGWDERGEEEAQREADEHGMISAHPLAREIDQLVHKKPARKKAWF